MNSYILTSNRFEGTVRFDYSTKGLLVEWSLKGATLLKIGLWKFLILNMPLKEADIPEFEKHGFKAQLVPPDLSFAAFWELYNYKVSKNKTEKLWKKLSDTDKALILEAVPKYKRWLKKKGAIEIMYPSTYLNKENERWLDQY